MSLGLSYKRPMTLSPLFKGLPDHLDLGIL
jgi:hypothetical protein